MAETGSEERVVEISMYVLCFLMLVGLVVNLLLPPCNKYIPFENRISTEVSVTISHEDDMEAGERVYEEEAKSYEPKAVEARDGGRGQGLTKGSFTVSRWTVIAIAVGVALFWCVPLGGISWGFYMVKGFLDKCYGFKTWLDAMAAAKAHQHLL